MLCIFGKSGVTGNGTEHKQVFVVLGVVWVTVGLSELSVLWQQFLIIDLVLDHSWKMDLEVGALWWDSGTGAYLTGWNC